LKRSIGADTVVLRLGAEQGEAPAGAQEAAERSLQGTSSVVGLERTADGVNVSVLDAEASIPGLLRSLDAGGVRVSGLSIAKPSLDDVFLHFTGRRIRTEAADQPLELGWM
jgi:ABC-2 type transport system ATP-binding protein